MRHTRRSFLHTAGQATLAAGAVLRASDTARASTQATGAAPKPGAGAAGHASATAPLGGTLCLFSKHLPDLHGRDLAKTVKGLGFAGIDLTVRPKGHVLPERAAADLPRVIEAIRAEGVDVTMITTAQTTVREPETEPIVKTAGALKIPYFKPGYYLYELKDVRADVQRAGRELAQLASLTQRHGVVLGYHNHEGNVGGPIWDMVSMIDPLDPQWVGYYYDVRHAVVEGGNVGWKVATELVLPRLKMIAIKDCFWEKGANGKWKARHCPMGQGMVDWPAYLGRLMQANYTGPISLHVEYPIAGASDRERQDNTIKAIQDDLAFLTRAIRQVSEASA